LSKPLGKLPPLMSWRFLQNVKQPGTCALRAVTSHPDEKMPGNEAFSCAHYQSLRATTLTEVFTVYPVRGFWIPARTSYLILFFQMICQ
jgi:hypothetical protein